MLAPQSPYTDMTTYIPKPSSNHLLGPSSVHFLVLLLRVETKTRTQRNYALEHPGRPLYHEFHIPAEKEATVSKVWVGVELDEGVALYPTVLEGSVGFGK